MSMHVTIITNYHCETTCIRVQEHLIKDMASSLEEWQETIKKMLSGINRYLV